MRTDVPILAAYVTPATGGRAAQAHFWCQHCEAVHSHGAQPGHRCAHCFRRESPYGATGYSLDIQGEVAAAKAVLPGAPYAGRRRLRDALEKAAPRLRSAVLSSALGVRGGYSIEKRVGRARVTVIGNGWWIDLYAFARGGQPAQDRRRAGRDLIALLACLFGLDRGLVGLRLLEAVSGASFTGEGREAIAGAIERAYGAQAGGRVGAA